MINGNQRHADFRSFYQKELAMMYIPVDAIIPEDKLTLYLLVPKLRNDKSQYLARGGFVQTNHDQLIQAIRAMNTLYEASEDGNNEYGTFYRVDGILIGVNGVDLSVTTIWIHRFIDELYQFVTLKPCREVHNEH